MVRCGERGEKREIRGEMRRRRKLVMAAEREATSAKICERLFKMVENGEGGDCDNCGAAGVRALPIANYQPSTTNFTIAVYLASPDEIDLTPFVEVCLSHPLTLSPSHPLRLAAPRWNGTAYELAELNGDWPDGLDEGPHGILEPPSCAALVKPDEVDLWIVPGLAFAKDGGRLGYGGGWYDRLMRDSSGRKVGVGYGFQLVEALPSEPHDVRLDEVVVARGVRFGDGGEKNEPTNGK